MWKFVTLALGLAAIGGWVANIIKMFGTENVTEALIRLVLIFVAPVGAIAGYL